MLQMRRVRFRTEYGPEDAASFVVDTLKELNMCLRFSFLAGGVAIGLCVVPLGDALGAAVCKPAFVVAGTHSLTLTTRPSESTNDVTSKALAKACSLTGPAAAPLRLRHT